ncbi:MAG: aminotransferase class IV [Phycisphaerae bacterium]
MSDTILFNGEFIEADQAKLSVWDGGWLHGAGLFETLRARGGRVFRLEAHLSRLMASAQKLLFPIDRSDLPSAGDFAELLKVNDTPQARVRLTVSAGPVLGESVGDETGHRPKLTVCVTTTPFVPYPESHRRGGMTVCIHRTKTSPDDDTAGHKTTCFLPRLLALRDAHARGCNEALWFTTANLLAESCVSNVFLVKDATLFTPPVETPVLPGITRSIVLELAGDQGLAVEQKPLTIDALLDADEVFLTNSIMEIMPVCRVEKREIGSGKPGPIAAALQAAYLGVLEKECPSDG